MVYIPANALFLFKANETETEAAFAFHALASILVLNQSPTAGACTNDGTARHIPDGFCTTSFQREQLFLLQVAIRVSTSIRVSDPFSTTLPTVFDLSSLISGASVTHHSVAVTSPALPIVFSPVYMTNQTLPDVCIGSINKILIHPIYHCIQCLFCHH